MLRSREFVKNPSDTGRKNHPVECGAFTEGRGIFRFSGLVRAGNGRGISKNRFTLIELVVTISIIVLTVSLVVAVFRKESPARTLENMEHDFRSYCARVRYRTCETGKDWVINYDPDTKTFSALPGKHEKFQMPGNEETKSARKQVESDEEDEENEFLDADDEESRPGGYAKLVWRLPENVEFTTEHGDEDTLMSGEKLEVFRFFPDGGGSGSGYLEFRCGELARIFKITKLTGRLSAMDKAEYERVELQ